MFWAPWRSSIARASGSMRSLRWRGAAYLQDTGEKGTNIVVRLPEGLRGIGFGDRDGGGCTLLSNPLGRASLCRPVDSCLGW